MFQIEKDSKIIEIESFQQMEKFVIRGKINKNDIAIDTERNIEAYVDEFLDKSAYGFQEKDEKEVYPDEVLEQKLEFIKSKKAGEFSEEEIEDFRKYVSILKKQDEAGEVDWKFVLEFKKAFRKIQMDINEYSIDIPEEQNEIQEPEMEVFEGEMVFSEEEGIFKPKPKYNTQRSVPNYGQAQREQRPTQYRQERPKPKVPPKIFRPNDEAKPAPGLTAGIVFCLFAFAPLGIILLWILPKGGLLKNLWVKILLTGYFGYTFITNLIQEHPELFELK